MGRVLRQQVATTAFVLWLVICSIFSAHSATNSDRLTSGKSVTLGTPDMRFYAEWAASEVTFLGQKNIKKPSINNLLQSVIIGHDLRQTAHPISADSLQTETQLNYAFKALLQGNVALAKQNVELIQPFLTSLTKDKYNLFLAILSMKAKNHEKALEIFARIENDSPLGHLAEILKSLVLSADGQYLKSDELIANLFQQKNKIDTVASNYLNTLHRINVFFKGSDLDIKDVISLTNFWQYPEFIDLIKAGVRLNPKKFDQTFVELILSHPLENRFAQEVELVERVLGWLTENEYNEIAAVVADKIISQRSSVYSELVELSIKVQEPSQLNTKVLQQIVKSLTKLNNQRNDISEIVISQSDLSRNLKLINLLETSKQEILVYKKAFTKKNRAFEKNVKSEKIKHSKRILETKSNGRSREFLSLEILLTELVGTTQNKEQSYQLLDGLSIWSFNKPFVERWWEKELDKKVMVSNHGPSSQERWFSKQKVNQITVNAEPNASDAEFKRVDFKKANEDIVKLLSIPRKNREKLLSSHLSKVKNRLLNSEIRIAKMLTKLNENTDALKSRFAKLLSKWIEQQKRQVANQLLSLVRQNYDYELAIIYDERKFENDGERWRTEINIPGWLQDELEEKENKRLGVGYDALEKLELFSNSKRVKEMASLLNGQLEFEVAQKVTLDGVKNIYGVKANINNAIRRFEGLLVNNFERGEQSQILYQLARFNQAAGNPQKTLSYLEQFARRHKDSQLINEVNFRIAELYFSKGYYAEAAKVYATLTLNSKSRFSQRAAYKLGWSLLKQGEYQQALENFMAILESSGSSKNQGTAYVTLHRDLLKVSASSFANLNGLESINDYFKKNKEMKFQEEVTEELALYYQRKYRYTDAAKVYHFLASNFSIRSKKPYYQSQAIAVYEQGRFQLKAQHAKLQYVSNYGITSPFWKNIDTVQRTKIQPTLLVYLQEIAKSEHAIAQKTKDSEDYHKAIARYKEYASYPLHTEFTPQAIFLMAETYYETRQYKKAVQAFSRSAYQFPDFKERSLAGYSALLSLQKLRQDSGSKTEKEQLLNQEIKYARNFINHFQSDKRSTLVSVQLGENLLLVNAFREALDTVLPLTKMKKGLPAEVRFAGWQVAANAQFALEAFADAESAYKMAIKLLANSKDSDQKQARQEFEQKIAESIFKQAEKAAVQNNYNQAIKDFTRVAKYSSASSELHIKSRYEAGVIQMKARKWSNAEKTFKRFLNNYSKHPLADDIPAKLIVIYENTNNWEAAAGHLNSLFVKEGATQLARDALWRTTELYQKANKPEKAYEQLRIFAKHFPVPLEAALEARLEIVKLAENNALGNKTHSADYWRRDIIHTYDKNKQNVSERSRYIVSLSALTLSEKAVKKFNGIAIALPLKKALSKKQIAMKNAIELLDKTNSYGLSEHATKSTLLMASMYQQLASGLMNSPRPLELNTLELEQYAILLEEQALPFEDEAIAFHEINLTQIKLGIYNDWVKQSLNQLRALMPSRYNKQEKVFEFHEKIQ